MKNKIICLFALLSLSFGALAQYVIPLDQPVTLPAPVVDEIEVISIRIFPGTKRMEIHAKAGAQIITAVRTGPTYDAVIENVDVESLVPLFIADLAASAAALAQPANPLP